MAVRGITRRLAGVRRETIPTEHERWHADRCTGTLDLELITHGDRYVAPGTGLLELVAGPSEGELVAQGAQRRSGLPVVPGTGIKGAVRTVYEMLCQACNPNSRTDVCRFSAKKSFFTQGLCGACALFGTLGLRGRVSFSDALPASDDDVAVKIERTPVPHEPDEEHTPGDFRIYDLGESREYIDGVTGAIREKVLAREVYRGRFRCRMTFWNATEEELGRLLFSLGTSEESATSFALRLGGVKYDGQGAVRVEPVRLRLRTPQRRELVGQGCLDQCAAWRQVAKDSQWWKAYGATLENLAAKLMTGSEGSPRRGGE